MMPAVGREGLADMVDAFCDGIAFSVEETRRVFEAARRAGPAAAPACRAIVAHRRRRRSPPSSARSSADHVEYASEADAAAMGRAGTVAVLLPGAFHMLRETQAPPVEAFRAPWRGDGGVDRRQSRLLADDLAAPRHEHGLRPVPADRARGHRRA